MNSVLWPQGGNSNPRAQTLSGFLPFSERGEHGDRVHLCGVMCRRAGLGDVFLTRAVETSQTRLDVALWWQPVDSMWAPSGDTTTCYHIQPPSNHWRVSQRLTIQQTFGWNYTLSIYTSSPSYGGCYFDSRLLLWVEKRQLYMLGVKRLCLQRVKCSWLDGNCSDRLNALTISWSVIVLVRPNVGWGARNVC